MTTDTNTTTTTVIKSFAPGRFRLPSPAEGIPPVEARLGTGGAIYDWILSADHPAAASGGVLVLLDGSTAYAVLCGAWPVQIAGPRRLCELHVFAGRAEAIEELGPLLGSCVPTHLLGGETEG